MPALDGVSSVESSSSRRIPPIRLPSPPPSERVVSPARSSPNSPSIIAKTLGDRSTSANAFDSLSTPASFPFFLK